MSSTGRAKRQAGASLARSENVAASRPSGGVHADLAAPSTNSVPPVAAQEGAETTGQRRVKRRKSVLHGSGRSQLAEPPVASAEIEPSRGELRRQIRGPLKGPNRLPRPAGLQKR